MMAICCFGLCRGLFCPVSETKSYGPEGLFSPPAIPASLARGSCMFCPAIDTWSAGHVEGEDAPGHVTGEDLGQDLSLGYREGLGELRGAGQNQFGHSFPQRESKTKRSSRVRPLL